MLNKYIPVCIFLDNIATITYAIFLTVDLGPITIYLGEIRLFCAKQIAYLAEQVKLLRIRPLECNCTMPIEHQVAFEALYGDTLAITNTVDRVQQINELIKARQATVQQLAELLGYLSAGFNQVTSIHMQ